MRQGGVLALGYQLRQDMPGLTQRRFPAAGHRLYDRAGDICDLATAAGFSSTTQLVKGPPEAPEGRVLIAVA